MENSLNQPEQPAFHFHVAFAPHSSWHEMHDFADRIKDADVVVPELVHWFKADQQILQGVSDGRFTLTQAIAIHEDLAIKTRRLLDAADRKKFEGLAACLVGTKKFVFFADLPAAQATRAVTQAFEADTKIMAEFEQGELEQAMAKLKAYTKRVAEYDTIREDWIVESLTEQLPVVLKQDGRFAKKTEIAVLVSFGSGHSYFSKKLKEASKGDVHRSFSGTHEFMDSVGRIVRAYVLGKEVRDVDLARGLIGPSITARIRIPDQPNGMIKSILSSLIADQLSLVDIQRFAGQLSETRKPPISRLQFQLALGNLLAQKGIPEPSSFKAILYFLKKFTNFGPRAQQELTRLMSENIDEHRLGSRLRQFFSALTSM